MSAPLIQTLRAQVPAVTILATTVTPVAEAPFAGTVSGVSYTPIADVTGAASPASRTISLINKGADGNGTTVVASLALLGAVNMSDYDEKTITLSVVAGATTVAAGDILAWSSAAVGGTGLVDPGGMVQIEITRS
jgi:hypothetical protein